MRQEGEPSVEEILESIKKVIARDNRENAAAERRRRESAGLPPGFEDEEEGDADGEVLELGDAGHMIEEAAGEPGATPILSDDAERTMRESLAELALLAEAGRDKGACAGGTSIEGMVREMLKPMLAQWLDRNMPAIVERMVKAEIARLRG
jgi:cell pole-organizing protein PopZ